MFNGRELADKVGAMIIRWTIIYGAFAFMIGTGFAILVLSIL